MKIKSVQYVLLAVALGLVVGLAQPAKADFTSTALGLADVGPVSVDHGFPVWYEDLAGLRLELCLDATPGCLINLAAGEPQGFNIDSDFAQQLNPQFGEAFWWHAEAGFEFGNEQVALLVLALEATWFDDAALAMHLIDDGMQNAFARVRARVDVTDPGVYTITHPFGTITHEITQADFDANVDPDTGIYGRGINLTQDLGCIDENEVGEPPCDFAATLANITNIGPFLTRADGVLFVVGDNRYLSDPTEETEVIGSPSGTNFFRIEGPGVPDESVETDLFILMGKVSGCVEGNLPPITLDDLAATAAGESVVIEVLANDMNDPAQLAEGANINPATVVIVAQPVGGTAVTSPDGTVTFTPAAGFTGATSFTYTVQDFCGLTSDLAMVHVLVEELAVNEADYRTRTGRWTLSGTSTFAELALEPAEGVTILFTPLLGAQEVPPRISAATGHFAATFDNANDAQFEVQMDVTVPTETTFTRAHIHLGETGTNGGILFDLCGETGSPDCAPEDGVISIARILSAAELRTTGDVEDFAQAVAAILSGRTYVNVHSETFQPGEIRGQLGRNVIVLRAGEAGPVIGAAEVGEDESWSFIGKANLAPGTEAGRPIEVEAESSLGHIESLGLRLR